MAYPHMDEMVWFGGRWWWFLTRSGRRHSMREHRRFRRMSIKRVGRSGRRCLKFKFGSKGVSSARPQAVC
jgi:hypothetical protein